MTKYLVRHDFDVLGDAADGWRVNDCTMLGHVEIDESKERYLEDYVKLLEPWFDPQQVMANNPVLEFQGDGYIVIDLFGDDRKPFIELFREDEDESND